MQNLGFIKFHRIFRSLVWYENIDTRLVMLELMLSCESESTVLNGIELITGQHLTSYSDLALRVKTTLPKLKYVIKKLEDMGELKKIKPYRKKDYTIFHLLNYEEFQGRQTKKASREEMKECKEIINYYNKIMRKKEKLEGVNLEAIEKAYTQNYTLEDIYSCIDGCSKNKWHMGQNEQKRKYNSLKTVLKLNNKNKFIKSSKEDEHVDSTRQEVASKPVIIDIGAESTESESREILKKQIEEYLLKK